MSNLTKKQQRIRRHRRLRVKVKGTAERPRLAIYRSLKHIYAQLIDDRAGRTLVSSSTKNLKLPGTVSGALRLGEEIAKLATTAGIDKVVLDRGGFAYHGQIKAVAEGVRAAGLKL